MRTPMRTSQRGASIWPFIISLLLLLMFVFLWFDRKSASEKADADVVKLKADVEKLNLDVGVRDDYLEKLAEVVGFVAPQPFSGAKLVPDPVAIKKAIDMAEPGSFFKKWVDASTVPVSRPFYKGTVGSPPPAIEIAKISQAFKDKMAEIEAAKPGNAPVPPGDGDDAAAVAKFESDKVAYEAAFTKYKKLIDEGVAMKDFDALKPVLGAVSIFSLDKQGEAVKWQFLAQPAIPSLTVEEILKLPDPAFTKMKAEWIAAVNGLVAQIDGLTKEKVDRDTTIEKTQADLAQAQTDRTNDVTRLSKDAQDAKDTLEKARVELTNAQNLLAQAGDKAKVDAASAKSLITALNGRILNDKELVDAQKARDDADGSVVGANNAQALVYVNLGSSDKVYAGLGFSVWTTGRGGFRVAKGEIVVTRVLDVHYSQARISSQVAPLGTNDSISNPLFRKDRPIHLFLAGDLKKYPKAIAIERLKRMNVIIDEAIGNDTDYVMIPAGVTATVGAAPADAAAPAAESEYEKLNRMARSFGASLISESTLSAAIDY